jgi:UDP-glucose 4-epimerase
MRAIVTGGAGFIGSNLVDALLDRGDEVTVVDNLSTGRVENLDGARRRGIAFHEADITDAERLSKLFAGARPDIVFHLAAQIDVRKSIEDPAWDAGINVGGTINVLDAARRAGVARVVNTSTGGAIYGDVDTIPTPETTPPRPMAAYGTSKLCAETYSGWFERLYGLSAVTLRYGNVYGPRQDPLGEAGVIAIFCGKLMSGERPVIFGDGRQTRDYVYVADVVAANLAAASHPEAHGVYNVGTGRECSVLEVLAALRRAAGLDDDELQPEFAPGRLGELQRSALDASRARVELGFTAQADLDDGMRRTLEWARAAAAAQERARG